MSGAFPYVTLGIAATQWMGIWALTALSPTGEPGSATRLDTMAFRWRSVLLRVIVTASFIVMSLRLWGVIGDGLRPAFDGMRFSFVMELGEAVVTILLWLRLRSLAVSLAFRGLAARAVVVLIGRGGTLIFLFVVPMSLAIAGHRMRLSWDFINIRFCLAVLWDSIAMLVLIQLAAAFLRASKRAER